MEQLGARAGFRSHYNKAKRLGKESFFFSNRIELGTWQNKGLGKDNSVYEVPPKSWALYQAFLILYH